MAYKIRKSLPHSRREKRNCDFALVDLTTLIQPGGSKCSLEPLGKKAVGSLLNLQEFVRTCPKGADETLVGVGILRDLP